jgi:SAM-dependent methyltransferase
VGWQHFERLAADYASARPPYPAVVFDVLRSEGVIGPGLRVLEVGAGAGLATRELVASGSHVVALEPGEALCSLLEDSVPGVQVLTSRFEEVDLAAAGFDSVVAATAMHWVDLSVGLPKAHDVLRPGGALAVFRTVFGDDTYDTEFRDRVRQIVSERNVATSGSSPEAGPTMDDLSAGAFFEPVRSESWPWSVELTTDQVTSLFRTFSDWKDEEVDAVRVAADACGGVVTEHYRCVLHLLRRAEL